MPLPGPARRPADAPPSPDARPAPTPSGSADAASAWALLDAATELVCAATPDGALTYANRAWRRALGYEGASLDGVRATDLVAAEDRARYVDVARRLVAGEIVEEFEAVLVARDGRRIACRGRGEPIMADDPAVPGRRVCVGTRAAYRDVTADRRADAMRASLATTMEVTADVVAVGARDGRLAYLNRAGRRLLGIADDDALAAYDTAAIHPPETVARIEREAVPALARGGTWAGEGALLTLDGERVPVSMVLVPHPPIAGGDDEPWFTAVMRDLRERTRAEAARAAREHELRTMLAAVAEVVVVLDADGTYLRGLPTAPDLYYEPVDALLGRRLHDVLPATHADEVLACIRGVLASGAPATHEYAMDVPRGRIWFAATVLPLGDGTVLWAARDVTARRDAEEALRASAAWHRSLVDALPLTVYVAEPGPEHPPRYVSRGVEALGWPREAWLRDPTLWRRILHPDDRDRVVRESDAATAAGLRTKEAVYRVIARDGTVRWLHDRAELVPVAPAPAEAPAREAWRGVLVDITARRQAELAARERSAWLSLVFNNATDLMFLVAVERDAAGEPATFRYEMVNDAFLAATGVARSALVGRPFGALLLPEAAARTLAHYRETVAAREVRHVEEDLELPAGRLVVETSLSPILDAHGACTHVLAVARDITERRRLEERLRQAQKMEAIGQFAGSVAHDFNNMLMVIRGNAEAALGTLGDDAALREPLHDVVECADRAAALTRQILAFSRRQVLRPTRLDLSGAIPAILRLLEQAVGGERGVRLDTRLAPDAGFVRADASQLTQVLLNLAMNARDAMPHGGTVTIETAAATLALPLGHSHGVVPPGRYATLRLRDTGTGMDAPTLARMYEPFFTTKGRGHGTGLGLATVFGIVQQSGAHIVADTRPGEGTTFTLYFPRLADEGAARAAGPDAAAPGRPADGRRVLLVDDEAAVRRTAQRMLEHAGFVVEAVDGGPDALAALAGAAGRGDLPSAVVTDVQMPGLGGRELGARIAAAYPTLPVVYMSGYTTDELLRRQLAREGRQVVVKPVTSGTLRAAVEAAITGAAR